MDKASTSEEQELMTSFLKLVMNYIKSKPLKENAFIDYQGYESLEKKFDTSIGEKGVLEETNHK